MADVLTGATGIAIDNIIVGTTSYRQSIVVGGASSGQIAIVSSSAPAGTEIGLYVRPIGSSGTVLASVAPSSTWSVAPTSGALVVLSSGPAQIGILGPSSANVIGSVAPSSVWSMVLNASSATVIGSVAPSSAWTVTASSGLAASTAAAGHFGLQVWSTGDALVSVGYSTVPASTNLAVPVRLSSGTAQFGVLGPSSANVIGSVAPSSVWSMVLNASSATVIGSVAPSSTWTVTPTSGALVILSSGIATIGALTTGTVVGLTTTNLIGLTTSLTNYATLAAASGTVVGSVAPSSAWSLGASSAVVIGSIAPSSVWSVAQTSGSFFVGLSTQAATDTASFELSGGVAATTVPPTNVASGKNAEMMVDSAGRVIAVRSPRLLVNQQFTNLGSTAETVIVTPSTILTGIFNDISLLIVSNRSTDTPTEFWMNSSSGAATPKIKISLAANGGAVIPFDPCYPQPASTQAWTGINTVVNTTVYCQVWTIPTL